VRPLAPSRVDACNTLLQAHPTWARDKHEGRGISPLTPISLRLLFPPSRSVLRRPIWAGARGDNLLVGPGTPGVRNADNNVFDMIAPRHYAYSELISERPSYFLPHYINGSRCETTVSLVKHRWGWLDIGMLSSPHWFELCGALPFALYGS
jgi:hypothetical protein